jgi:hypothetical protein
MHDMRTLSVLFVLVLTCTYSTAQPPPLRTDVRKIREPVSSRSFEGVVEKIDADEITLVEKRDRGGTMTHRFVPIDLLRNGKCITDYFDGANSYLWADVKAGDTVRLETLRDEGDGKTYCLQISIRRRPGGKLPASQNPEKDRWYDTHRVMNEIENGNDVSDEELLKVCPPQIDPVTKKQLTPGGLYTGPYREKLDANRKRIAEEKEKALKAKPTDGKSDPKKDDKK